MLLGAVGGPQRPPVRNRPKRGGIAALPVPGNLAVGSQNSAHPLGTDLEVTVSDPNNRVY